MNKNSNEINNANSNSIITKSVLPGVGVIGFVIFGLYLFNFHYGLSINNDDWGTFGDYFGGILNPVIAVFVLYLVVETYKLQKTELQETKRLINDQVKLAALTALLNSNLTR
ncbi:MAG: hypothetical protein WAW61_12055, partial [Methylococcaceae bacterium]